MYTDNYSGLKKQAKSQDLYIARISHCVDEMMSKEEVFRERLHRQKIITHITRLMKKVPPSEFLAIADGDFQQYVGKLMARQLVDGIFEKAYDPLNLEFLKKKNSAGGSLPTACMLR